MPIPRELFVSHASADRRLVDRLAQMFERHGIPYWYSRRNLIGAQQWHDEIGAALERCDWFLIVLSPAAMKSEWVKRELLFALNDRRYRNRIVPVAAKTCDYKKLSWTLDALQRVDFTKAFEDGCRELLCVWSVGCREVPKLARRK
jgi:hypothetical protein